MSMSDRDGKIWMDGQLVDWRDAKIHVLTHTLHYGCGAFEGVRAYNTVDGTAIFRLRGTHRAPLQQRQDPAHEDPLHLQQEVMGRAEVEVVREPTSSKAATCARSPGSATQKLGVSPEGQHHPPDGRGLGLGCVPRRRGHAARYPRQDQRATRATTSTSR